MRFFDQTVPLSERLYSIGEAIRFIRNHTTKQNLNVARYFINRNKPLTKISWNPFYATVIVESRCCQRCKFCLWHSRDTPRPYWPLHLKFEEFKHIADILAENNLAHIHFCGTGEPLFNEDLFRMIEYAHKKKMTTSMMSNCSAVMTQYIDKIASSDIIRLFTNIDSGFPEQFEEIKEHAKWNVVINNIKKLSEARERAKKKFKIGIYCLAMRSNYKSYKQLMKVAYDIGADEVWFSYLQPFEEMNEITSSKNVIQKADKHIIREIDEAVKLGSKLGLKVFPPHFPPKTKTRVNCDAMWWKIMINLPNDKIPKEKWIGNVSTHCFLAHVGEAYSFGNILNDDFDKIWNGEKIQKLREQLLTDAPEVCKECPDL